MVWWWFRVVLVGLVWFGGGLVVIYGGLVVV